MKEPRPAAIEGRKEGRLKRGGRIQRRNKSLNPKARGGGKTRQDPRGGGASVHHDSCNRLRNTFQGEGGSETKENDRQKKGKYRRTLSTNARYSSKKKKSKEGGCRRR